MIARRLESSDLAACATLFSELVETHQRLYPDGNVGGQFEPPADGFVVEDGGRVVGFAGLIWHGRRAEIEPIVVAPGSRSRGAGRLLAESVIEHARAAGADRVFARPVGRNTAALAFFHSVGLEVVGRVEVQLDFDPRERKATHSLAGKTFLA